MNTEVLSIQFISSDKYYCYFLNDQLGNHICNIEFYKYDPKREPHGLLLQDQMTATNYRRQGLMRKLHSDAFEKLKAEGYKYVYAYVPQCLLFDQNNGISLNCWEPQIGDKLKGGMQSLWPLSTILMNDGSSPLVSVERISSRQINGFIAISPEVYIDLTQTTMVQVDPNDLFKRLTTIANDNNMQNVNREKSILLTQMVPLNF